MDKLTGLNGKQINNKAPSGYEIPFAEGAEKQFYLYADRCVRCRRCETFLASHGTRLAKPLGSSLLPSLPATLMACQQRSPCLCPLTLRAVACRTHPNDQGHQVIAELLGSVLAKAVDEEQGDNCQFSGGWADSHAAPRLRGLPPPMIPGNADVPTSLCAMQVCAPVSCRRAARVCSLA